MLESQCFTTEGQAALGLCQESGLQVVLLPLAVTPCSISSAHQLRAAAFGMIKKGTEVIVVMVGQVHTAIRFSCH